MTRELQLEQTAHSWLAAALAVPTKETELEALMVQKKAEVVWLSLQLEQSRSRTHADLGQSLEVEVDLRKAMTWAV